MMQMSAPATAHTDPVVDLTGMTEREIEDEISRRLALGRERLSGRLITPHQPEGVRFLIKRELSLVKASILSDEMGLGKTVQMITTCLADDRATAPTLIVCDLSLVRQWESEIKNYAPSMPAHVFTKPQMVALGKDFIQSIGNRFVITTYGALNRNPVLLGEEAVRFHRIILDEAHKIKNQRSQVHRNACQLRGMIRHCITGTPITKNRNDMTSLLKWCGLFTADGLSASSDEVRSSSKKYVLRRTFADLTQHNQRLALPPLTIRTHDVELSDSEKDLYNRLIQYGQFAIRARDNAVDADEIRSINNHIFKILLRLQQCVVDSKIISKETIEDVDSMQSIFDTENPLNTSEIPEDSCAICLDTLSAESACRTQCRHCFCMTCMQRVFNMTRDLCSCPICRAIVIPGTIQVPQDRMESPALEVQASSKMEKLRAILSGDIRREKVIIFTHWKAEMEIIQRMCQSLDLVSDTIHGGVDMESRNAIVQRFQDELSTLQIVICQIQTAACGLNLTAARHVIFTSLDWTPATHMQALARAHRIGQTQTVTVHYIVATGTVDQHVINKQYFKLAEASNILDDQRIMRKIGNIVDKKTNLFNILEPLR